jgi:hypothetical protein
MTRTFALLGLLFAGVASARTLSFTAEDCDQMAVLSAKHPKMSWAATLAAGQVLNTENQLQLYPYMTLLMRFDLTKIPKDVRITKAELTMPISYLAGGKSECSCRRILAEWGTGVCHTHRMRYPKEVPWAQPGCRGGGTDRAAKDSGVFRWEKIGDSTIDVTEDIELWHTGAAANRGWVFALDTPHPNIIYAPSPYAPHVGGAKQWKLQITFEPQ